MDLYIYGWGGLNAAAAAAVAAAALVASSPSISILSSTFDILNPYGNLSIVNFFTSQLPTDAGSFSRCHQS